MRECLQAGSSDCDADDDWCDPAGGQLQPLPEELSEYSTEAIKRE